MRSNKRKKKPVRRIITFVLLCMIVIGAVFFFKDKQTESIASNKTQYFENQTLKLETTGSKTYLTSTKTKQKLYGLQELSGKQYYFNKKTGVMEYGLKKIDGYYYYFTEKGYDDPAKAYQAVSKDLTSDSQVIEDAISIGMKLVDKSPYVYGGGRTDSEVEKHQFDCSSFVAWAYRKAGQPLVYQYAASTTLLAQVGDAVTWDNMQRGDLLVTPDGYSEDRQHVAIYLGDGFILHDASSTNGVAISRLNQVINKKTSKTLTWQGLFEPGTVRRVVS
ncbi:gamma-glutamyl-diamino acid-endopeptidase [Weissella muntiaci]|uniref:Gamma-glutamyl-diamino acid-endopeptidase n=1 Tax=Weissella muntiaci TaxID=2508881 RepID=A0A6C2CA07_9LACO|nr:C40 family peptidase [Weissella muntiaci]TYC50971.1 gamma-glutamyl-diamino acid-endopeptidase [Weissella muntiaci]